MKKLVTYLLSSAAREEENNLQASRNEGWKHEEPLEDEVIRSHANTLEPPNHGAYSSF